ncbi:hypothetical protein K3495_g8981 [Podosphaera aphanis]|nr:hypothetical protein K3495_g8981 [Podosphaera aphanis]
MAYPPDDEVDMEGSPSTGSSPQLSHPQPIMLPPHLWNIPYLTLSPQIWSAAVEIDPERVSRLFNDQNQPATAPIKEMPPPRLFNPARFTA